MTELYKIQNDNDIFMYNVLCIESIHNTRVDYIYHR